MSEIAAETEIDAPLERVYAVVTDADRLGEWLTVHHDVEDPPREPLEEGSAFEQTVSVKGAKIPITWTATSVDPPHCVEMTGEGPAGTRAVARIDLRPLDEARTHLAYSCRYEPPGGLVGKVANKLAGESAATGEADRSFENLRRLLG